MPACMAAPKASCRSSTCSGEAHENDDQVHVECYETHVEFHFIYVAGVLTMEPWAILCRG